MACVVEAATIIVSAYGDMNFVICSAMLCRRAILVKQVRQSFVAMAAGAVPVDHNAGIQLYCSVWRECSIQICGEQSDGTANLLLKLQDAEFGMRCVRADPATLESLCEIRNAGNTYGDGSHWQLTGGPAP